MKKNTILITLFFLLLVFISCSSVLAQTTILTEISSNSLKPGEEFTMKITIPSPIASTTIEIYFDTEKLEFLEGPENSNFANNRILYTWVNEQAKGTINLEIGDFHFRSMKQGTANIVVTGEFYQEDGTKIDLDVSQTEVRIENSSIQEPNPLPHEEETMKLDDTTQLKSLRIDQEGLIPSFDPEIKEYYFITDQDLKEIEVTAITQNNNAQVNIMGNTNLKSGINVITIEVTSSTNTKKSTYIIYVTKTQNLKQANANLETLAIREGFLSPEWEENITRYETEVPESTESIDVLAIPQSINAKVSIEKSPTLEYGSNTIDIVVTAEDGITQKKYQLIVYRRNKQEEILQKQEEQLQIEQLSSIQKQELLNQEAKTQNNIENSKSSSSLFPYLLGIVSIVVILLTIVIYYKKRQK